jgi:ATP-dependent Clp protease ATP-binding subunit ClpC
MDAPARIPRPPHACSCDVLLELVRDASVAALLGSFGVDPERLAAAQTRTHAALDTEPGDWRGRIPAGAVDDPLQRLLAIVRSADCHGYRVLELAGVDCPALRRQMIARRATAAGPRAVRGNRPRALLRHRPPTPTPLRVAPRAPTASVPAPARNPASPAAPNAATTRARSPSPIRRSQDHDPARDRKRPEDTVVDESARSRRDPEPEPERASLLRIERALPKVEPVRAASLPKIFGRAREVAALADACLRASFRPILLLGPAGSGRSLLARHVVDALDVDVHACSALELGDEPTALRDRLASRGAKDVVIVDDLDRLVLEAPPPWLGDLTHAWIRGGPRIIVIASPETLGRLHQWIPGILEIADVHRVAPPCAADAIEAIAAAIPSIAEAHGVTLDADLRAAELLRLSDRFLVGLAQPRRALDLLDFACARARRTGAPTLSRDALHDVVAELARVPRTRVAARHDQDALDLEARLAERVVGHTAAIETLAKLVRRNRAGLGGGRPILGALLLGPSGVGKTELAKALAWSLFDRDDALVRLDMSEYAESHAVARIVGAPPGYVGFEQGGALVDPVLAHPHCVVLLDEIEKAHRDVHQLLLQILDEGRLTDGRGRTVDFRHAAILLTSNLGADLVRRTSGRPRVDEAAVLEAARAAFPVELWNRIEAPLVMQPLGNDDLRRICRRIAKAASDRLFHERGIRYSLSEQACEQLVLRAGDDPRLGARPLRHLVAREIDPLVADAVLRGRARAGMSLVIEVDRGRLVAR